MGALSSGATLKLGFILIVLMSWAQESISSVKIVLQCATTDSFLKVTVTDKEDSIASIETFVASSLYHCRTLYGQPYHRELGQAQRWLPVDDLHAQTLELKCVSSLDEHMKCLLRTAVI